MPAITGLEQGGMRMIKLNDLEKGVAACQLVAKFEVARRECTDDIKSIVDEMMEIVASEDATADERRHAAHTVMEALFPGQAADWLELWDGRDPIESELDNEEREFSNRVRRLMKKKGISQVQLGEMIGVGQTVISMLLNRNCRPQARTVDRIADALKVDRREIWPFGDSD